MGRDRSDLRIDPAGEFRLSHASPSFSDRIPAFCVTVYSTYKRRHDEPGVISE